MAGVRAFDGSLCSPLAAVLDRFIGPDTKIMYASDGAACPPARTLQSNSFSRVMFSDAETAAGTGMAIQFSKFSGADSQGFQDYIVTNIKPGEHDFPKMSRMLLQHFRNSLSELFENAAEHSETRHIYTCGEHFPEHEKLNFIITDAGIGVAERIRRSFDVDVRDDDAIKWAFAEGSTTRTTGVRVGGNGLKFFREFIDINRGRLFFVSGHGYYERHDEADSWSRLDSRFPGTSVAMEIDTDIHKGNC